MFANECVHSDAAGAVLVVRFSHTDSIVGIGMCPMCRIDRRCAGDSVEQETDEQATIR